MKKRAIIFDLDGTLLNTLEDLTDCTNFALRQLNYPEHTIEKIRDFVGNGVAKLIERATPDGIDYKKCLEIFKENYSQNMYNKTAPYEGILPMLSTLKEKGYKIAIVSNKFDAAVKELCQRYFPNLIDTAIGENEALGIRKKPAPDTVVQALKELQTTAEYAIFCGDSDVDIMSAKNANMPCISVTWGFRNKDFLLKHGAEIIVNTPQEIIDVLENQTK